jgi:hypothetical protein
MNEDVQRPLHGDATAVLIATINGIQSGIQKANDPVVECDHKVYRRSSIEHMILITSHLNKAP